MAFIEHIKSRNHVSKPEARKSIRVTIKKRKLKEKENDIITIWIGSDVAERLSIDKNTRLSFFYCDVDNKRWLLRKSTNGYKIVHVNRGSFRIQIVSHVPNLPLLSAETITYKVIEDDIELFLK